MNVKFSLFVILCFINYLTYSQVFIGNVSIQKELKDMGDIQTWRDLNLNESSFNNYGTLFFDKEHVALLIYSKDGDKEVINQGLIFKEEHDKNSPLYNEFFIIVPSFITWTVKGTQMIISYYSMGEAKVGFFVVENFATQEMYIFLINPDKYSEVMNLYK